MKISSTMKMPQTIQHTMVAPTRRRFPRKMPQVEFQKCGLTVTEQAAAMRKIKNLVSLAQAHADEAHSPKHVQNVRKNSCELAGLVGADRFYAEACGLLHDIGCAITNIFATLEKNGTPGKEYVTQVVVDECLDKMGFGNVQRFSCLSEMALKIAKNNSHKGRHSEVGAFIARYWLSSNCPEIGKEGIGIISTAIREHSSVKRDVSPYGKLLQDADKRDAWGAYGYYRAIADALSRGWKLFDEPCRAICRHESGHFHYRHMDHVGQQLGNIIGWFSLLHFKESKILCRENWQLFTLLVGNLKKNGALRPDGKSRRA